METQFVDGQGGGAKIAETRISVYDLLPHFMDPSTTEAQICRLYEMAPEQVAAARAYILNNLDAVLSKHLEIEKWPAAENPPEVIAKTEQTRATLLKFKDWLVEREKEKTTDSAAEVSLKVGEAKSTPLPSFKDWLAESENWPANGS